MLKEVRKKNPLSDLKSECGFLSRDHPPLSFGENLFSSLCVILHTIQLTDKQTNGQGWKQISKSWSTDKRKTPQLNAREA